MSFFTRQTNFIKKPWSNAITDAVKGVTEVLEVNGIDGATRVYAEATSIEKRERWARDNNFKESRSHACPRRLLGKKCNGMPRVGEMPCVFPGMDHVSMWNLNGKPCVLVSQPYGIDMKGLEELVALCGRYGLNFTLDADPAWHFPGRVLHMELRRADDKDGAG